MKMRGGDGEELVLKTKEMGQKCVGLHFDDKEISPLMVIFSSSYV